MLHKVPPLEELIREIEERCADNISTPVALSAMQEAARSARAVGCSPARIRHVLGPVLATAVQTSERRPATFTMELAPVRAGVVDRLQRTAAVVRTSVAEDMSKIAIAELNAVRPDVVKAGTVDLPAATTAMTDALARLKHAGQTKGWKGDTLVDTNSSSLRGSWRLGADRVDSLTTSLVMLTQSMRSTRLTWGATLALRGVALADIGAVVGRGRQFGYDFRPWLALAPDPSENADWREKTVPAVRSLFAFFGQFESTIKSFQRVSHSLDVPG
jgi:hypothetical protein